MSLVFSAVNISEGRRRAAIDAVIMALAAHASVRVLDVHSDPDHNRSVLSCAGPARALADALYDCIRCAAQHIDMDVHEGQHPRIGATDVVPLVPLFGTTMDTCIRLAGELGARVGDGLQLPVWLYALAARNPRHRKLADLRRGGYEGLKNMTGRDNTRRPDFGPARVGKAGAVAIGAREALIAWNVWLTSGERRVAQGIARRIRASNGGLPGVQALGMLVRGRAQVSMNLTDYRRSGLTQVMQRLETEARREGVELYESELVGLIPRAAVEAAEGYDLLLSRPIEAQILERRLRETGLVRITEPSSGR